MTSLVILNPDLPYKCVLYNYIAQAIYAVALLGITFVIVFILRMSFKVYRTYEEKQKDEVRCNISFTKISN